MAQTKRKSGVPRGPGAPRGLTSRPPEYDPRSEKRWRPTANFDPQNAIKLREAMQSVHPRLSVAAFLDVLANLMPTSAEDPPLDWPTLEAALRQLMGPAIEQSEELPLAM